MNTKPLSDLFKELHIKPNDPGIYEEAFTHSSMNATHKGDSVFDYERLEFLGDSLVGFVVADLCYKLHPDKQEGELTSMKIHFSRMEYECLLARNMNLASYVKVGPSYTADPNDSPSLMSDIFESFIGALLLDQGLDKAVAFLSGLYLEPIKKADEFLEDNPKSELQEFFQADYKEAVTYRMLDKEDTDKGPIFHAGVYFEGRLLGEGKGKSKKDAEQAAAKDALSKKASYKGIDFKKVS